MTDVLVVAELMDGGLRKTTLSAIRAAREIASATGGAFDVLSIGEGAAKGASQASGFGARKILVSEIAGGYTAERYAPTVASASQAGGHAVVVTTASTYGKDLLPRVAARLSAGIASDISEVMVDGGQVSYRRPMYAGNIYATMTINTAVQCVTVRQSEFEPAEESGGSSPTEELAAVADAASEKLEFVSLEVVKSERPELTEASTVVSGGRALKSSDNFKAVLEPLVDAFGAAMGASRAACDAGYVPNDLQVGQTGKVVAPQLYVAVGISGAIQHLAGMKGSKIIVAINKDKEAPIAQVADYFLVADLFKAVPELTEAVSKARAAG